MKLTNILAGTALAAIALTGATTLPAGLNPVANAEAAVNISFSVFYNDLGRYGDWVNYRDSYVFIPGNVRAGWRPYTLGHWVYTKRYGWTWASDEPFGWATYHYGRWGYAEDIGWYWVPGKRWAPAWVSWRRSKDYVVWAPLPPSRHRGADVSISINVGDIPDYYWVAVPTRRFLEPNLSVVIVNDDRDVIRRTKYIGTPRITNNIVINNVIDVNVIEKETGHNVKPVEVRTTENPTEARASADQVTVFQGEISADAQAKPDKLTDVGKVKKVKRNGEGSAAGSETTTQPDTGTTATTPPPAASTTTTTGTGTATTPEQPVTGQTEQPANGNKKKKQQQTGSGETAPAPATNAGEQSQQPAQAQDQQKKRKKQPETTTGPDTTTPDATQQGAAPQDNATEQTGSTTPPANSGKAKGKDKTQNEAPAQDQSAPANDNKAGGKGNGKKKQENCDPATDASCVPAQQ